MKSLREWVEENNLNEIFGLFGKPKTQAPAPAPAVAPPKQKKAWCPFCLDWSAVEEDAYYPHGKWEWQCQKCRREWDSKTVADREKREPDDYADRGTTTGTFLRKDEVKPSNPGLKESLYLSGLISEEAYYEALQQPGQPGQPGQQPNDDHLVRTMAANLHDDWRKSRIKGGTHGQNDAIYEPRMKPSGLDDGKEVDIAQHYDKLTPKWQGENKAAAETAIALVRQSMGAGKTPQHLSSGPDLEALADKVHQAWMQRNPKADYNAAQHVPYASLPEEEKQKDRDHVLMAVKLISSGLPGKAG